MSASTTTPATRPDVDLADLDQVLALDLADPALYATDRPERIWRTMRRSGTPVLVTARRRHWAVTRYQQVREVLRRSEVLSSEQGMRLGEKASDVAAGAAAGGRSVLVSDDPAHARVRRVLEPAFTPKAVRRLAEGTRGLADRLVSEAIARPSVDFVEALVAPLLTTVSCDLVGVPEADREALARLSQRAFCGSGDATASTQISAHVELLAYCDELVLAKRRRPGDDVASILATAQVDGAPIPRSAAVMNCHDLILGGNASARYALTSVPLTMLHQRPFWDTLRAGGADVDAAVRELLRCEAPVNHIMRTLLDDLEVGGVRIPRGELVTLWLRSANRDEEVFAHPDEMRLDLPRRAHLAFGAGPHHCLAANLARLEISALLCALADRVGDVEPTGPAVRMESDFLRGYREVPVSLSPR